jgi:hypothetical protein
MSDPVETAVLFRALWKLAIKYINQGDDHEAKLKFASAAVIAFQWGALAGDAIDEEAKWLILAEQYGLAKVYGHWSAMQGFRYLPQFDIDPICWRDKSRWPLKLKKASKKRPLETVASALPPPEQPPPRPLETKEPTPSPLETGQAAPEPSPLETEPETPETPAPTPRPLKTEAEQQPGRPLETEQPETAPEPSPLETATEQTEQPTPRPERPLETTSRGEYLKRWRAGNPVSYQASYQKRAEAERDYRQERKARYTELKRQSRARLKDKEGT